MSKQDKYNHSKRTRLLAYLRGKLSERERNALEKEFQRDPFQADAAEGLSMLGEEEVVEDLARLRSAIYRRASRRRRIAWYSAAAAIASLLVVSTIFFNLEPGEKRQDTVDRMSRKAAEQAPDRKSVV